jgi:hypothetical protein
MGSEATPRAAARVLEIETYVKDKWALMVVAKASYTQNVPHLVAGAFGEYYGYPLCVAKESVRRGFLN